MEALFSIRPRYLDRIFDRQKTVELRNRPVRLPPQSLIWLYATRPRKRLEGRAVVLRVIIDTPVNIWRRFRDKLGLTRIEFFSYVGSRLFVSAIQLTKVERFAHPLRLGRIRAVAASFQPPQFYLQLSPASRLYEFLKKHADGNYAADRAV
jgi:predicted transcriptional regulator